MDVTGVVSDCAHLACFAHSLQPVVRDGLGNLAMARSVMTKCCKLTNLVHQSALFRHACEKALGRENNCIR